MATTRKRVLFLDPRDSTRSRMAEGLLRKMAGETFEAFSASAHTARVDPLAVDVMAEVGIDIRENTAKPVDEYRDEPFDFAIGLCLPEKEEVPRFENASERLRWTVDDPIAPTDEQQRLKAFRNVRDSLQQRLRIFMTVALRPRA